ncbi:MAG: FlgO family outer membrane protein [Elusimicrobiota bacterium]
MNKLMKLAFFVFLMASQTAFSEELEKLVSKLEEGIKDYQNIKMAVLEFPYTSQKLSEGPIIIQERLTTNFVQNKKITLIERNLLKKVLAELNLQSSGAIDEDTTKKLGKVLGADAVVTGTLNDLENEGVEINARIVQTETGKILSAANTTIKKTWKDTVAPPQPPSPDYSKKPLVQVAILLDTSGSMDGLINQARTQLWKIINELISSEKNGNQPVVEVAVYEYGNNGLSLQNGYTRQVQPFTTDLDKVASELFALKTNGGDEYCGYVVKEAVGNLNWSKFDDVYKTIFIAGNEPFTQGTVDFNQAVSSAKAKGIFVNTIFCGRRQEGIATQWKAGADLADGEYTNIDQSASVVTIVAPQDDKITELGMELSKTYIIYGRGAPEAMKRKMGVNMMAKAAGAPVLVEKYLTEARSVGSSSSWDLVSAIESGAIKKDNIKKEDLPEELKKMDKTGIDKYIDQKLDERKKVREQISKLQEERKKYIDQKEKETTGAPFTLDKAIIDAIHKQTLKKGFKFK